jgi:hypothetical protein
LFFQLQLLENLLKKFIPAVFSIALLAASLSTQADTNANRNGEASDRISASRTVVIGPNTRWVNVAQDEVVTFVSGREQFSWHFDGTASRVSLQQIAPSTFNQSKDVYVYVASGISRSTDD